MRTPEDHARLSAHWPGDDDPARETLPLPWRVVVAVVAVASLAGCSYGVHVAWEWGVAIARAAWRGGI